MTMPHDSLGPVRPVGSPTPHERLVRSIESATTLDRVGDVVRPLVDRTVGTGRLRDLLTGRFFGHPVHPAGVVVPMSCWIGGTLVDVVGGRGSERVAQRLIALGSLAALPVALTGAADWLDTRDAEQRVGTVHALANQVALSMFTLSWLQRRRGRRSAGVALAVAGTAVTGAAAYLGGHLTYRRGVGVDTTAFRAGPTDWQELTMESSIEPDQAVEGRVGTMSFAVVGRTADAPPDVLESRCTHRGGPLHDGEVVDGCVECPWHGSRFDRRTGAVTAGPASAPQPVYEVRLDGGSVMIRRDEAGGLRRNPDRRLTAAERAGSRGRRLSWRVAGMGDVSGGVQRSPDRRARSHVRQRRR